MVFNGIIFWEFPYSTRKLSDEILASTPRDPLEVLLDPFTRLGAKRFKEAINRLLKDTGAMTNFERILKNEEQALINLIHV